MSAQEILSVFGTWGGFLPGGEVTGLYTLRTELAGDTHAWTHTQNT